MAARDDDDELRFLSVKAEPIPLTTKEIVQNEKRHFRSNLSFNRRFAEDDVKNFELDKEDNKAIAFSFLQIRKGLWELEIPGLSGADEKLTKQDVNYLFQQIENFYRKYKDHPSSNVRKAVNSILRSSSRLSAKKMLGAYYYKGDTSNRLFFSEKQLEKIDTWLSAAECTVDLIKT